MNAFFIGRPVEARAREAQFGMNQDFFKGTKVEAEAKITLAADEAHRATAAKPAAAHIG